MGLFSNPMTINDGVGDRIFSFRAQQPDSKSVVGDYIEDAAAISAQSLLVVKHDSKPTAPRHLLQRTINLVPAANADSELKRVTLNFTLTCDKEFTAAEVTPEFVLFLDALSEVGFLANLMNSKI
jgi:hypothetical protein